MKTAKPRMALRTLLSLITLATLLASASSRAAPNQQQIERTIASAVLADWFTRFCYKDASNARLERTTTLVEQRWQLYIRADEPRLRSALEAISKNIEAESKRSGGCHSPAMQKLGNDLHAEWSSAYNKLALQP